MYLYTSQEIQLIHEERVGRLMEKRQVSDRKAKANGNEYVKNLMKLIKREEA
jgi:hypothetical protein